MYGENAWTATAKYIVNLVSPLLVNGQNHNPILPTSTRYMYTHIYIILNITLSSVFVVQYGGCVCGWWGELASCKKLPNPLPPVLKTRHPVSCSIAMFDCEFIFFRSVLGVWAIVLLFPSLACMLRTS